MPAAFAAMSTDTQTPTIAVADSAIHGRGVFVTRPMQAGTVIGEFQGTPTTVDGMHVLWLSEEEGLRVENELRYVNHSDTPNAEAQGVELVALRNLQVGEEITFHYGPEWAAAR